MVSAMKINNKSKGTGFQTTDHNQNDTILDKSSTGSTNNINVKQYLCVRHSLPKTQLKNAILYDNVNENKHLRKRLSTLRRHRERTSLYLDINKRCFESEQEKKQNKWKREDEETIASWNLPVLAPPRGSNTQAIPHAETIYSVPTYNKSPSSHRKPVLPMLSFKREKTEIVTRGDKTFLAKLPEVVEVDYKKLEHYNSYTGKVINKTWSADPRFLSLASNLQPLVLRKRDECPIGKVMSKSKASRISERSPNFSVNRQPAHVHKQVAVASRRSSYYASTRPRSHGGTASIISSTGKMNRTSRDFTR
ncbi:uncharacterized protein LOC126812280 [Patella vulgata]|uniref:uncharacterized protein LOC126812280 n=1 Tax=Patella vulgata TaxID=6465 RepID=UPI00217FE1BF|nr:uncharacterized protein LOC126812280 [Patella vulgata]